jgi:DNA topoisomerase-2
MAPKTIAEKYKKHELRDHVYELPDSYVGNTEPVALETYLYDDSTKSMAKREITYVPALFKCFDEVLVNTLDQATRLKAEAAAGKTDIKHVKNIKVNIDKATGVIVIFNDGDGVDVEKHPTHNDMYIPELIFGHLLTSANYDKEEDKTVGGRNGMGAKLTNIFSHEFTVETLDHRHGRSYKQKWSNNMLKRENPTVRASSKASPFTRITWKPDYERFGMTGMTDDLYDLFRRRTMDAGACTDANVAVYFNDVKLEFKDFEHFVDLFIGSKVERPRAYEVCNADGRKWEVVATYSDGGQFDQVSFVNGINTLRGGKHVDYVVAQVSKKMNEVMAKKKKDIKAQHIRDNLWIFVKSTIVNPTFDSQTKETLTTQASKFGSKCELSDKFMVKLFQTGLVDRVTAITDFHDKKKLTKTDGKKTSRVIVPKLDDANKAGTKDSAACTLILCEGDSAKTMAIAGLSVVGRDYYGVFPLKGKVLNVKDAQPKKIADNDEISNLKKILGLEQGKNYADVNSLRYGSIMIMTDQDVDGFHIRGLLFNVFQSLWPSLFKMNGFLTSMRTPIVKAIHPVNGTIAFYNIPEFEAWRAARVDEAAGLRGWHMKYYKGLGTSTAAEAKEYFKSLNITFYKHDGKASEDSMDLAFNKKRADDRKAWLMKFDPSRTLDYSKKDVSFSTFVHDELIHFSNRDLERSIPSMVDGLKESTRKIMFGCLKKKLYTKEIRVAQLSGYISEVAVYHHGEKSLQDAIVRMAQDYVGANNINLLSPNGQFGTRIQGGDDAASPRYIHTLLSPLARLIFREEDNAVLKYQTDDGTPIEPEYYVPVIPMVLVNGGIGIGTGFSTNIPAHNPTEVIAMCAMLIASLDAGGVEIARRADLAAAFERMEAARVDEGMPWTLGFTGSISKHKEGYISKGTWKWINETNLEITELPIGTWTEDYKEMLTEMIANNHSLLKDFENHYTDKKVGFMLKFYPGKKEAANAVLETEFKLASTKNMSMNNLHLYNAKGAIQRFKKMADIVKAWARVRLTTYFDRKENLLKVMEADYKLVSAKVRFIQDFIDQKIEIMNKKEREVDEQLARMHYPKLDELMTANTEETEREGGDDAKKPTTQIANYRYLTNMPIRHLTFEEKTKLEKEARVLKERIDGLRDMQIHHIWRRELEELRAAWEDHRMSVEKGLAMGVATPAAAAKKRAK